MRRSKKLYALIFLLIASMLTMNTIAFAEEVNEEPLGGEESSEATSEYSSVEITTTDDIVEPLSSEMSGSSPGPSARSAALDDIIAEINGLISERQILIDEYEELLAAFFAAKDDFEELLADFFDSEELEAFEDALAVYEPLYDAYEALRAAYPTGTTYAATRAAYDAALAAFNAADEALEALNELLEDVLAAYEAVLEALEALVDAYELLEQIAELDDQILDLIADYCDAAKEFNEKALAAYLVAMKGYAKELAVYAKNARKITAEYLAAMEQYKIKHAEYVLKKEQYLIDIKAYIEAKEAYEEWLLKKAAYDAELEKIASGTSSINIRYNGTTWTQNYAGNALVPGHFSPFLTPNSSYTHAELGVTVRNLQGGNTGAEVTVSKPGIYTVSIHINNWNFDTITFYVPDTMVFPATFTFGNYAANVIGTGNEGAINQIGRGVLFTPPPGEPPKVPKKPHKPKKPVKPTLDLPCPPCPPTVPIPAGCKIPFNPYEPESAGFQAELPEYDLDKLTDPPRQPGDNGEGDPPGRGSSTRTVTGGDTPVNLTDPDVPLAQQPPEDFIDIPDDETPLVDLPQTGIMNCLMLWLVFFGASLVLTATVAIRRRVRNNA